MYGEGDRKLTERIKLTEEDIIEAYYQGKQVLIIEFNQAIPYSITKQQILEDQKTVEKINRVKQDTEVLLSDGSENKEELQRVLNLLNYLLDARQSMETVKN